MACCLHTFHRPWYSRPYLQASEHTVKRPWAQAPFCMTGARALYKEGQGLSMLSHPARTAYSLIKG